MHVPIDDGESRVRRSRCWCGDRQQPRGQSGHGQNGRTRTCERPLTRSNCVHVSSLRSGKLRVGVDREAVPRGMRARRFGIRRWVDRPPSPVFGLDARAVTRSCEADNFLSLRDWCGGALSAASGCARPRSAPVLLRPPPARQATARCRWVTDRNAELVEPGANDLAVNTELTAERVRRLPFRKPRSAISRSGSGMRVAGIGQHLAEPAWVRRGFNV